MQSYRLVDKLSVTSQQKSRIHTCSSAPSSVRMSLFALTRQERQIASWLSRQMIARSIMVLILTTFLTTEDLLAQWRFLTGGPYKQVSNDSLLLFTYIVVDDSNARIDVVNRSSDTVWFLPKRLALLLPYDGYEAQAGVRDDTAFIYWKLFEKTDYTQVPGSFTMLINGLARFYLTEPVYPQEKVVLAYLHFGGEAPSSIKIGLWSLSSDAISLNSGQTLFARSLPMDIFLLQFPDPQITHPVQEWINR